MRMLARGRRGRPVLPDEKVHLSLVANKEDFHFPLSPRIREINLLTDVTSHYQEEAPCE